MRSMAQRLNCLSSRRDLFGALAGAVLLEEKSELKKIPTNNSLKFIYLNFTSSEVVFKKSFMSEFNILFFGGILYLIQQSS